jgi:hypothetical protein
MLENKDFEEGRRLLKLDKNSAVNLEILSNIKKRPNIQHDIDNKRHHVTYRSNPCKEHILPRLFSLVLVTLHRSKNDITCINK